MLQLKPLTPFAHGGNRLCFVHPEFLLRCIKVRRPEFSLRDLRKKKKFPKRFWPLSWLDESVSEYALMQKIDRHVGELAYQVLPRCYGFEDTDMGPGLVSELIRNENGEICYSVMQYVWELGYTPELRQAVEAFTALWPTLDIPVREILLHNVVVQCDEEKVKRLVVIDGLGESGVIPWWWLTHSVRVNRSKRRVHNFVQRIDVLLEERKSGKIDNPFWVLKHKGVE